MTSELRPTKQVIEAKLYPGVGASSPIKRQRFEPPEEFLKGLYSVILIQAPAGYGKSTLMSQLHEYLGQKKMDCAWLSLDDDDNDPSRFLRHLVAAIQRARPGLISDDLASSSADFSNGKSILELLAFDLGNLEKQLVVFLDDIQLMHSQQGLEILDWLISYAPPQCQFVLGSREEPNLHLGKLRVRRKLLDYKAENLQFTLPETAEFLGLRLGSTLPARQIEQLHKRTEGWPAGLELGALALESEEDRDRFIESFAGDDRSVVEYLGEVVLSNLDTATRQFLYQIAQFDRISAKLAEHVSGRSDALTLLRGIQARNLFLIALDRQGEWFRFHHLVSEYLRDRARTASADDSHQALVKGAQWLYSQGLSSDAINCALRAEAWEQAAAWVAEVAEPMVYENGYLQTVLNWMERLPEEWLNRYPVIRITYCFALIFYPWRKDVAEHIEQLRSYIDRLAGQPDTDQATVDQIESSIGFLELLYAALLDDGEKARDLCLAWLERWPDGDETLRGITCNVLSFGYKSLGQINEGLEATERGRQLFRTANAYYGLSWNYILTAYLYMKTGDYRRAQENAEKGLETIEKHMHGNRMHASMCHAILGTIAYEFGDYEALRLHAGEGIVSADEYGQADFIILKYWCRARMHFLQGDSETALDILHSGQRAAEEHALERPQLSLAADECAWLCRLGRLDEARQVASRFDIATRPDPDHPLSGLQLDKALRTGSRIWLHEAPEETARALESGIQYCQRRGFEHRRVELLLIQASAYRKAGDTDLANQSLRQALLIGAPHDYYHIYLDEAHELGDLIMQLKLKGKDEAAAKPLLIRLQRALKKDATEGKPSAGEGMVEKLSKRETQILRRLDSELSNREIAEAIFVSEGTLKWHLHNIYGKLGVKNRSGALSKARELNYL